MLGVLAYAGGRATAYAVIGVVVARALAAAPRTTLLLQRLLQPFLGPLLIGVYLTLTGTLKLI